MKNILCIGTLIADIINEKIEKIPDEYECIPAEVSLCPGGNAYSLSVNLARLVPPDTSVHCYGLTGTDMLGSLFENSLRDEGITCHLTKTADKKTSCNMILQVKGKDRRYIFSEGANASASIDDIHSLVDSIQPDIVVFGELPSLGIVGQKFIKLVNEIKNTRNTIICLDTLVTATEDYNWMSGYWSLIDIVHCNTGEGRHITKKMTPVEICQYFLDNGVSLPVISDGEKGSYYGYNGTVDHVLAFIIEEVDATGAGDAMIAGILSRLLENQPANKIDISNVSSDTIRNAIRYGCACGAIAASSLGCISDINKTMVEKKLNE